MSLGSFLNSMPCFPLIKPRKRATKTEGSARGSIRIIGLGQSSLTGSIAGVNVKYLIKLSLFFLATFSVATVGFCLCVPRGAQLQRLQYAIHLPRQLSSAPLTLSMQVMVMTYRGQESPIQVCPVWLLLKELQHGIYSDFVNQFINVSEYLLESTVFRAI